MKWAHSKQNETKNNERQNLPKKMCVQTAGHPKNKNMLLQQRMEGSSSHEICLRRGERNLTLERVGFRNP